jgi:hypothetical protein
MVDRGPSLITYSIRSGEDNRSVWECCPESMVGPLLQTAHISRSWTPSTVRRIQNGLTPSAYAARVEAIVAPNRGRSAHLVSTMAGGLLLPPPQVARGQHPDRCPVPSSIQILRPSAIFAARSGPAAKNLSLLCPECAAPVRTASVPWLVLRVPGRRYGDPHPSAGILPTTPRSASRWIR